MTVNRYGFIFWGVKSVLILDRGDGCVTVNMLKTTEFTT